MLEDNQDKTIEIIHAPQDEIRKSMASILQVSPPTTAESGNTSTTLSLLNKRKTRGIMNPSMIHL